MGSNSGICNRLGGKIYPKRVSNACFFFITVYNVFQGVSSIGSALTAYVDSLVGHKITKALRLAMPINVHGLSLYPDFLSFAFILLFTSLLCQ
jgi:hypothetical protein